MIFGGFVWYFFILPISIFIFILNVFKKPEIIIPNDFSKYSYTIYFILAFYLIWWRLLKTNNRPLRENNTFLKFTESLIAVTILLIALMDYALLVAFSFSTYQEHLVNIIASFIFLIILLLPLYYIFLKIFPITIKENFFSYSDRLPSLNLILKNKKLWTLIIILISVLAALIGMYSLRTTTQIIDEKTNRLLVDDVYITPIYWHELRSLFYWDEIPGNDNNNRMLLKFLEQKYGVDWVNNAKIEKIDNGKVINISTEKNSISLRLNDEKTKINLKIDDGRTDEFIAKTENNKLDIYVLDISGNYFVEQNISIKFRLIPWTKIKPNITLRDSFNNPTNPDYDFATGSLLIKNTPFNTTYVTLNGIKKNNVPKFYALVISDLNDSIQRWDIEFNNTYLYPIEINNVNVEQIEGLKYIKYDRSALSLNEVVMENGRINIRHVDIYPDLGKIYSNRSITLYFEKIQKV